MIGNFEGGLENSNIEGNVDSNRNMEAERPMDGMEQPFSGEYTKDIIDLDDINAFDSERTTDYLPGEPVSFSENNENRNEYENNDSSETREKEANDTNEKKDGLTDEQKKELQERTGWPDEIIDNIGSMEEAEIYEKAGLKAVEIDGKWCLIRNDIDLDQVDEDGISNRERMERGRPPITKDGKEVELHHIGQKQDSPLAELTTEEHRGTGNDAILHDKTKESEIDRTAFAKERKDHWKSRVNS